MTNLDYLDGNIIPFPSTLSKVNNIYCFTAVSIGSIACIWLLATNLLRNHSASTKLLLSGIFADLMLLGSCVFTSIVNQIAGGFSLGKLGCLVTYYTMIIPACVSIATLGVVALERYQIVCKGIQWSDTTINLSIAAIWGGLGLVIGIPLLTSNYSSIRLEANSINCNVSWFDRSPQSLIMTSLIILEVGSSFAVALFSYYNVYMTYANVTKKKKANEDNQRIVFHKCVTMTLCLVVSWTPYYMKIVYEIISGKSTDADWASIGNMCGLSCSILNPFILCIYDNRVRGNMLSIFGSFRKVSAAPIGSTNDRRNHVRTIHTVIL